MSEVTVIGSYIVAHVIDTGRIPVTGETVTGRHYHVTHGGKGSNMACCAARLGASARFLGKVGNDAAGDGFLTLLRHERVATHGVLRSRTLPTATGFIVCAADGSNLIVIDPGANADFLPADVAAQEGLIAGVTVSPLEIPLATALEGAKRASRRGVPSILNPAPAEDLRGSDLSAVFALTPNEGEAAVCLGMTAREAKSPAECARRLLDLGPRNVIVTLGAEGVLWASREAIWRVPALAVDVVDTVGAGDAFNAGLAAGLCEGWEIPRAIAFGVAAASLSTRKRGTIESYALRDEVAGTYESVLSRIEAA